MDYAITICEGTSCLRKKEAGRFHTLLLEHLKGHGLQGKVKINISGCLGMCAKGPLMVVNPGYTIYGGLKDKDVAEIVEEHLVNRRPVARLVVEEDHLYNRFFRVFGDMGFFGKQMRITLRNCGIIDPENIDDYLALRGYEALAKVLTEMTPQQVIDEVKKSGLRGRGGAGFPTGLKWELTAREKGPEKYVICNADEGDPGAFMDRSAIEGDPHTVLEGMAIGGYAIGSTQGIVYIRAEYPLAIKRLEIAIAQARQHGLLGKNILGTDFQLRYRDPAGCGGLRLRRGDGPDPLDRGGARHAPAPAALPCGLGSVRQAHPHQQRRDLGQYPRDHPGRRRDGSPASARRRARAPRSLPWPAAWSTPAWWRCPWARPCGRSSTTSAAASRTARSSRPCRPAGRRAGACPSGPRYAGGLRVAGQGRLDHGLRRHDRDRRDLLHGGHTRYESSCLLEDSYPQRCQAAARPLNSPIQTTGLDYSKCAQLRFFVEKQYLLGPAWPD